MGRLSGKRIVVTGAGGMMGADMARAFRREGADLILSTRSAEKLAPLVAELAGGDGRVVAIAADFGIDEHVDRLAQAAWAAFGGVDGVLLSSQPQVPGTGSLLDTPDAVWDDLRRAIAFGPLRLMRALAPKMMAAGGGSVVSVVSSTGIDPIPGYGAYGLAKGELLLLTRYMAAEWGRGGIRANAICPGSIATGGPGAASADDPPAAMLARTALNRLGGNHEVTGAAIHLLSDEASYTTGQCLHVNGGRI